MKAKTHRNVTLSLPEDLLKQIKILAAQRDTSISALMTEQLVKLLPEQQARQAATENLLELMRTAPNSNFGETIPWKREDTYDRHER